MSRCDGMGGVGLKVIKLVEEAKSNPFTELHEALGALESAKADLEKAREECNAANAKHSNLYTEVSGLQERIAELIKKAGVLPPKGVPVSP